MTFEEILDQAMAMLQRRGRLTYSTLKRQFQLDDAALEDVKNEFIYGQRLAVDEEDRVLVWTGEAVSAPPPTPAPSPVRVPLAVTPVHLAEKIVTSRSALEGERKQITVLFADLKGSMELLADRDPEEARQLLDPVLERMIEAVHRYEGTVNQVMGDGIMALFGAPIAHEDHAVRACYAALRMQETVTDYGDAMQRSHGVPVQIRVGLNSGEVVVRAIDSSLHMDYTAVGQTTHLAARLEQMARPGSVLITGETLRLAEGFIQVKGLGPVAVKGLADPAEVFELIGASATRTRLQALAARGLTRFVGRQAEFETLRQALERASASHGQVVAVIGEPGVGKTRLFYELIRSHHAHDWLQLESSSVSYGKATAYLPVRDLLKAYFQVDDRDEGRKIREKVTGKLLTLDATLGPTLPAFLALLDMPVEDQQWQDLDPTQRRQRTLEAIKHLLLRESQVQPLLLVFENLHWIDAETQAVLDSLIESLPTARLLLLVNYRPEYQHGWGNKTYYTQLRLDPLPPVSAEELHRSLGHLQAAEFLYETSLFPELEYTCKHALTHEVAYGSLLLERRRALHAGIVGASERLYANHLAAQAEWLAQHALRGEVWDKAVAYCRQAGTRAITHSAYREAVTYFEQALSALHRLPAHPDTQAQAIDLRLDLRRALFPLGEIERVFVYLQEAQTLAEVLGDHHRLGLTSASLSNSFMQVGETDRALASGLRALAIATDLRDVGLAVTAQPRLGLVYSSLGDYPRAVECFRKNVARLHGELLHERLGMTGVASVLSRSFLACNLAESGAFAEGRAPAAEGVRIAEAADHPYSRILAYWAVGFRCLRQGELPQAIPVLERALDLAQVTHIRIAVPWVAAPLGAAYAVAGRTTDALLLLEQAVEQAMAMPLMIDQALRIVWLGEAYLLAGRLDEVYAQAQRALEFSRAHKERGHEAYALRLLGALHARHDPPEVEPAATRYRQALVLAEALGMRPLVAHCHLGLGTLSARTGQREPARAELSTAIAMYRAMAMTFWLPQAEVALAQVEER